MTHPVHRGRRSLRPLLFLLALSLIAAACGGSGEPNDAAPPSPMATGAAEPSPNETVATTYPVSVPADNGEVTIDAQPERIVSLSPTATEMLFAIGAGDLVVAADEFSNYPEDAPTTDLSGFEPNVEAILEFEPDLVIAEGGPEDLVAGLEAAQVPVLIQNAAADLEGAYRQIEALGLATGHGGDATDVIADMQSEIADIVAGFDAPAEPISYYHELDNTYYSVTSNTFIGEVYALLGMQSIADAAAEDGNTYPQLNEEFILETDPDVILLADTKCCGVTAESVAQRPGWDTITAVGNGTVVELDDDVASRWGPRIVDLLRTVADEIADLEPDS